MIDSAREALARLRDGNHRFVTGIRSLETMLSQTRRGALADQADHLRHGAPTVGAVVGSLDAGH